MTNLKNVTFTSTGTGTLEGNGKAWWGIPGIGYLERGENRLRLFHVKDSQDILVEHWFYHQSPYWTFYVNNVHNLEVRWTDIEARRTEWDEHDIYDLTAFNTDGFDVTGRNVWIHDCNVWNEDDTIAVKDDA